VVVYVFRAKAMVAIAAGAISKFKIGVFGISFAADCAFMAVVLICLLPFDFFCGFFEINCLWRDPRLDRAEI